MSGEEEEDDDDKGRRGYLDKRIQNLGVNGLRCPCRCGLVVVLVCVGTARVWGGDVNMGLCTKKKKNTEKAPCKGLFLSLGR